MYVIRGLHRNDAMSDEWQNDRDRGAQSDDSIEPFETLKHRAKRARVRADEAIRQAERFLERAAQRAVQWLDGY